MKAKFFLGFMLWIAALTSVGQEAGYIINRAKTIKTEYTPVPKDFKSKKLSWGGVQS